MDGRLARMLLVAAILVSTAVGVISGSGRAVTSGQTAARPSGPTRVAVQDPARDDISGRRWA
jgi:hypothetical protein